MEIQDGKSTKRLFIPSELQLFQINMPWDVVKQRLMNGWGSWIWTSLATTSNHQLCLLHSSLTGLPKSVNMTSVIAINIYSYAPGRCFYPKWVTLHSRYTLDQFMHFMAHIVWYMWKYGGKTAQFYSEIQAKICNWVQMLIFIWPKRMKYW